MKAVTYLVLEGTVVASRVVEVPARPPEAFSDGSGRMTRGTPARTIYEVGVNCPALVDGQCVDDVRQVQTVQWASDDFPANGTIVRYAVEAQQMRRWNGSRFVEWISLAHRGDAPEHRASILDRLAEKPAAPRSLAATGS